MLHKIRIQNGFTHKDSTFEFKDGHTVIVGKNGRGKSLIPEFIQFAFWGTKALRGEADDYKKLVVELWFFLKGKNYRVLRSVKATLLEELVSTQSGLSVGVSLASGTRAVDAKIEELFGYSFDVFKIANAANQGAIAALSSMKPAARKRMVDETIGLDIIETLEKFIGDQAKVTRATLSAKEDGHVLPIEPVRPENYSPLAVLDEALGRARNELQTVKILESQANMVVSWPAEFKARELPDTLENLRQKQDDYTKDQSERAVASAQLKKLPEPRPEVHLHEEDAKLDQLKKEQAYENDIASARATLLKSIGDTPQHFAHSSSDLEKRIEASKAADAQIVRWKRKQQILSEQHTIVCPNCEHEWHDEDPRLSEYGDVPEEVPVSGEATNPLVALLAQARKVEAAAQSYIHLAALVSKFPDHSATIKAIEAARNYRALYENSLGYEDQRKALTERLAQPFKESYGKWIAIAEEDRMAQVKYDQQIERAKADQQAKEIAVQAVAKFPTNLAEEVARLEAKSRETLVYDQQKAAYTDAMMCYHAREAEVSALRNELEEWGAARSAMMEVRSQVKGYLLPSLNKVATNLLTQMTGGELQHVYVNEDFDITVDGLGVDKLSGAGKDVSNLALRLGLGTVLTNQTFSTLLLDEVDQGCDDERSVYIAKCLGHLTKTFKQVIVISHKKDLPSDHRIEL